MPTVIDDPFYVVLRGRFDAFGVTREQGEIVDTSEWKNVKPLVDTRKLGVVPIRIEDAVDCPCGRKWVSEDASAAHACPARAKKSTAKSKKSAARASAAA